MTRQAWVHWCVVAVAVAAAGCKKSSGETKDAGIDAPIDAAIDAPPSVTYENLTPTEWSLALVSNQWQIAISDVAGDKACALSTDQHNGLDVAGGEIIIHLPDTATGPCPAGSFTLQKCPNNLGTEALVPAGCGFYRKFDASGAVIGTTPSLSGLVKIAGTVTSCTMIVTVGFLGKSFTHQATLVNGQTAQPWCVQD